MGLGTIGVRCRHTYTVNSTLEFSSFVVSVKARMFLCSTQNRPAQRLIVHSCGVLSANHSILINSFIFIVRNMDETPMPYRCTGNDTPSTRLLHYSFVTRIWIDRLVFGVQYYVTWMTKFVFLYLFCCCRCHCRRQRSTPVKWKRQLLAEPRHSFNLLPHLDDDIFSIFCMLSAFAETQKKIIAKWSKRCRTMLKRYNHFGLHRPKATWVSYRENRKKYIIRGIGRVVIEQRMERKPKHQKRNYVVRVGSPESHTTAEYKPIKTNNASSTIVFVAVDTIFGIVFITIFIISRSFSVCKRVCAVYFIFTFG